MGAGVIRRFGAYCMDWYLSGILAGASVQLTLLFFGGWNTQQSIQTRLTAEMDLPVIVAANFLTLLFFFLYYVVFPMARTGANRGKTIGYSAFRLEIMGLNNEKPGWRQMLIRNYFGLVFLQVVLTGYEGQFRQMMERTVGEKTANIMIGLSGCIALFSVLICIAGKSHRTLNDYLAQVKVIVRPKEN